MTILTSYKYITIPSSVTEFGAILYAGHIDGILSLVQFGKLIWTVVWELVMKSKTEKYI